MNVMSYNAMTAHTMCEASCACLQAREFPDDKVLSPRCIVQIGLATQTHHALLCVCVCVCPGPKVLSRMTCIMVVQSCSQHPSEAWVTKAVTTVDIPHTCEQGLRLP